MAYSRCVISLFYYNKSLVSLVNNGCLSCLVLDRRPPGYWQQLENREAFFLELAKELDFDPMIADNWVRLSPNRIYERKVCCEKDVHHLCITRDNIIFGVTTI